VKGEEKMERKRLPNDVKKQVEEIVTRFNASDIRNPRCRYVPRYRGRFLYLDREDYGRVHPIGRLEYTGKMGEWSFAPAAPNTTVLMRPSAD
jgi:hypothetical protein